MTFDGKAVFLIGGASRLGAATARWFADAGARIAIADIDGDRAQATAGEPRDGLLVRVSVGRAMPVASDVTSVLASQASHDSRWITGHTIPVDRGYVAR
jgi:NAD(P)-dependent dehydrogenase (short-subunit alcohol dehydrogenase family)